MKGLVLQQECSVPIFLFFHCDDLPVKVYLYGQSFDAVFLNTETREWSIGRKNSPFIQELLISCRLKFTGFLIFVMVVCIAVIPHGKVFYMLDSHCRDGKGLPVPLAPLYY